MPKARSDVYLVSSRPTENEKAGYDNTGFSTPEKQADISTDGSKVVYRYIYYWHKVKHIPFVNTTEVLGTLRTKTFERYRILIVENNKIRIPASG